ncbi:MAG: hypothetical protein AAFU78_17375 [Cyanobacteria bacterium J06633_2]
MVSNIFEFLSPEHNARIIGGCMSFQVKVFDVNRNGQAIGMYSHIKGGSFSASPALRMPESFDTEQDAYEYLVSCWQATDEQFKDMLSHRPAQAA